MKARGYMKTKKTWEVVISLYEAELFRDLLHDNIECLKNGERFHTQDNGEFLGIRGPILDNLCDSINDVVLTKDQVANGLVIDHR